MNLIGGGQVLSETSLGLVGGVSETLSAILMEAELSKRIPRSPAYRIELPAAKKGMQRFLAPEQINRLAEAIMPRYRVLVLVGVRGTSLG
jgi:hypothetical protein